jgi:Glyoxalase-like domain
MQVDHVVIGVTNLSDAADRLGRAFGLTSVPGGSHRGWGTANRLVPLGECYLELVTVVDPAEAAVSPFGRWVAGMIASGSGWGWVVRTEAILAVADRLGLIVADGSRPGADGRPLTWKLAGVEQARQNPSLPFFIQWGRDTPLPGRAPVTHGSGSCSLSELVVAGDDHVVRDWLGQPLQPVRVVPGTAGVTAIQLQAGSGTIRIEPADLTD